MTNKITEADLKELENFHSSIVRGEICLEPGADNFLTEIIPKMIAEIRQLGIENKKLWLLLEAVQGSAIRDDGTCPICLKDPHSSGCVIECVGNALLEDDEKREKRIAAELAAVREERDEGWEMESAGTLGYLPQGPKNPGEFTSWLVDLVEAVKQDLLSPSPCGKKGHKNSDMEEYVSDEPYMVGNPDNGQVDHQQVTHRVCTACQREEEREKSLVDALENLAKKCEEIETGKYVKPFAGPQFNPELESARAALKALGGK